MDDYQNRRGETKGCESTFYFELERFTAATSAGEGGGKIGTVRAVPLVVVVVSEVWVVGVATLVGALVVAFFISEVRPAGC